VKIAILAPEPQAEQLRRAVAASGHGLAWTAAEPTDALALCAVHPVDLLLVDIITHAGAEMMRRLVASRVGAVLAVANDVGADATRVFVAMDAGAIDAIDMPATDAGSAALAPFLAKLEGVARRLALRPRAQRQSQTAPREPYLVAIGASAGGPAALAELLGALPGNFPAAIVIVQHVDRQFAPDMALWLDDFASLPVRVAHEGDHAAPGVVLLANTNDHLVFKGENRLGYTAHPRAQPYRPSVDAFFHSVEAHWRGDAVGVLLTGMGRDGAQGLKALRNKGCYTIAQDQASSAVYGMPRAAATLDAAVDVLPLSAIATRLIQHFSCLPFTGV